MLVLQFQSQILNKIGLIERECDWVIKDIKKKFSLLEVACLYLEKYFSLFLETNI